MASVPERRRKRHATIPWYAKGNFDWLTTGYSDLATIALPLARQYRTCTGLPPEFFQPEHNPRQPQAPHLVMGRARRYQELLAMSTPR